MFFFTALLAATLLPPVAAQVDEVEGLRRVLRAGGVGEETIEKFDAAVTQAEEEDDIAPLRPFFSEESAPLVFIAGLCAVTLDPEAGSDAIRTDVESGRANEPALLMALAFDHERPTIGWLIRRLKTDLPPDQRRAIVFALQVLTDRNDTAPADWDAWWNGDGKTFRPAMPDPEEQLSRMERAAAGLRIDLLRDVLAKLKSEAPSAAADGKPATSAEPGKKWDPLANITRMLGDMADVLSRGRTLRLSTAAKAGDYAMATGDFPRAAAKYAAAIAEDPGDVRSQFLGACIRLENGDAAGAQAEFEKIAVLDSAITSAKFLAAVSARRLEHPGETMDAAALTVWRDFAPKPEMTVAGWDDPVAGLVMAQAMNGGGVFHIPTEKLEPARQSDDPERMVGAALIGANALRGPTLDEALKKFPDSTVAVAAQILTATSKVEKAEASALADRLAKLDPDNSPSNRAISTSIFPGSCSNCRKPLRSPFKPETTSRH